MIRAGDLVEVIDGPHKGRIGKVYDPLPGMVSGEIWFVIEKGRGKGNATSEPRENLVVIDNNFKVFLP